MEEEPQSDEKFRQRLEAMRERLRHLREKIDALPPYNAVALRRLLPILLRRTYLVPPREPKAKRNPPLRAKGQRQPRKGNRKRVEPFDWLTHRFLRVE